VTEFLARLHSDPLGVDQAGQVADGPDRPHPSTIADLGRVPLSGARPGWLPAPTDRPGSFEWLGDLLFRAVGCHRVSWSPDGSRFSSPEQPPPPDPRRTLEVRRAVASGGAKYPCEVYLLSRSLPGLPDGVFHVDPARHELAMVATPPPAAAWRAAVPSGGDLTRLAFVLVCRFTNSTPKYGNFAYRLSAVDTGVVAGRLCSLLADDGVPHRLRFGFDDDALDTIIRAHGRIEGSYAVITADPDAGPTPAGAPLPMAPPKPDTATTLTGRNLPAGLARAHAAARRWTAASAVTEDVEAAPVESEPLTLELISRRRSDGALFDGKPVSLALLDAMLDEVAARFRQFSVAVADWPTPPLRLGVAVHRVNDLPAGVYLAGETGVLRPLRQGDVSDKLQGAMHIGNVNLRLAAFVTHVLGPSAAWSGTWGPRGYRTSQMVAGTVVDAITLAAARGGLSANPFLGFDTAGVRALYPGLGPDEIPLVQVAVGGTRPAPRMEGPVTA
jgi:SagB-type dehydrogenase family enzyme